MGIHRSRVTLIGLLFISARLTMKRQRNSYTVKEKQKAVELARRTSNKHAAQYFTLDLTMLGRWVKKFSQEGMGDLSHKNTRSVGSRRRAFFPEEEVQLYQWIMNFC
jgi:transposase-like protein